MNLFKGKFILFLQKTLTSILYFCTALTACFFAFFLILNFLGQSFSKEQGGAGQQKQQPGAKQIIGDIFKNLKQIFSEAIGDSDKQGESAGSESGVQPVEREEVLNSPEELENTPPPAPESFEGPAYGAVHPVENPAGGGGAVQEPMPAEQPMAGVPVDLDPAGGGEAVQEPMPAEQPMAGAPVDLDPAGGGEAVQEPMPAEQPMAGAPVDLDPAGGGEAVQEPMPAEQPMAGAPVDLDPAGGGEAVQEPMPAEQPSEASLEVQTYMEAFPYDSSDRRDPFEDPTYRPVVAPEKGVIDEGAIVFTPRTPPEEYNLDEMSLKGIIWNNKTPKALFELPNSVGYYSLVKGDKIGKNGVLFEIRESEVVVVETNIIGKGENKKEERVIKIKRINRISGTK